MSHRIREAMKAGGLAPLGADGGPVEVDETYFARDRRFSHRGGKSMKGVLVEYPPGGKSDAHTHPGSAFIYATVLEGAIKSQVNDGPVKIYHAGENFSENPGDRHMVSENASDTKPAKFLVFLVKDKGAPILVPVDE